MYKVFYNDRTVFFIENIKKTDIISNSEIHYFKTKKKLKKVLNSFLDNQELDKLYVIHKDIKKAFKKFAKLYRLIEAAGGLVKNDKDEILVIYRREKWDLAKGKLEKNETPEIAAIREVEEECGINKLEIKELLETTYHTYRFKNKDILKRTYWFEMIHHGDQNTSPQTEEEITEVKWVKTDNLDEITKNTFPSIIEVLKKGNILNRD